MAPLGNLPIASDERGESDPEESAGCLHNTIRKTAMAAWNIVLGDLQEAHDPDQQRKYVEAVLRVAEAKRGSNGRKGRKPL